MCLASLVDACAMKEIPITVCAMRSEKEWMVMILEISSDIANAVHWISKGSRGIHWMCPR